VDSKKILLAHGSGGSRMHSLIRELILGKLDNPVLRELSDSAFIDYREKIAFSTDSFVVNPLFFPGADIGKLAVCGTVNDLVMQGAAPEYLSLGLIIEEGLEYSLLEKIIDSIAVAARKSSVLVACGDLKVVEKGAADKIFINTSGIGRIIKGRRLSVDRIRPDDEIIITGGIAEHGLSVLARRNELGLGFNIKSDCSALDSLLVPIVKEIPGLKFMRDPTRGGLATLLNEIIQEADFGVIIREKDIPILGKVSSACELLGVDPLYVASEGRAVIVVDKKDSSRVLARLRRHYLGRKASIIGKLVNRFQGKVVLETAFGTQRVLGMLSGESLPRIC
jgi:hydrogenase expression/formation protein HypE